MTETWLEPAWGEFLDRAKADRMAHAMLLAGPAGIGKSALAKRMAAWLLCLAPGASACGECRSCALLRGGAHPERHRVTPPEDKHVITVDQVRTLTDALALTTTISARKVAVLEPAEAMNVNAANALLKNLEEPPGDTVMLLVSHDASRLPVTIRSRCQVLKLGVPSPADAAAWLRDRTGCDAATADLAVQAAGGSPLQAEALLGEDGLLERFGQLRKGLVAVLRDPSRASAAAAHFGDLEPELTWDWLSLNAAAALRHALGAADQAWLGEAPPLNARALAGLQRSADRNRRWVATAVRQDLLLQDWLLEWGRQRSRDNAA